MFVPDRPSHDSDANERMDVSVQYLVGSFVVVIFVLLTVLLFDH